MEGMTTKIHFWRMIPTNPILEIKVFKYSCTKNTFGQKTPPPPKKNFFIPHNKINNKLFLMKCSYFIAPSIKKDFKSERNKRGWSFKFWTENFSNHIFIINMYHNQYNNKYEKLMTEWYVNRQIWDYITDSEIQTLPENLKYLHSGIKNYSHRRKIL